MMAGLVVELPDSNGHRGGAVCLTGAGPYQAKSAVWADFFWRNFILDMRKAERHS
jgi:hypothetical protein